MFEGKDDPIFQGEREQEQPTDNYREQDLPVLI